MRDLKLLVAGDAVRCSVTHDGETFIVRLGTGEHRLRLVPVAPGVLLLTAAGRSRLVHVAAEEGQRAVHVDGVTVEYAVGPPDSRPQDDAPRRAAGPQEADLTAPMPGVVTRVFIREGTVVKPGQPLVSVEAMKMEHVIRATHAGTVLTVHVREGEQVDGGAVVAEIGSPGPRRRRAARQE